VIASYGVETLGKKNWAIVHSTDAFGMGGLKALSASLDKLGAKAAIDQGYPNQSQDFTPVVLAVKSSGADIIGSYFTFPNDQAIFARQLRQLGLTIPWVGSPTTVAAEVVKLAGPALWGTYGVADFAIDASPEAKEFAKLYSYDMIGRRPPTTLPSLGRIARAPEGLQQREMRSAVSQFHRLKGQKPSAIRRPPP
jgi:branched-chain amino acid transport system substrate-binding protein